ncbi:MFS transporter [Paraburkholderia nemoris]|uniref:MFS transporter n=1 Tax=Paraburkholderia nemoris TaxID=2793076 RepID=UPI0038BC117B
MNRNDPRMILLATSIGSVIVMLDTSIVNVALERISQDLGGGVTDLQWIVNSYVLLFASLLLSGGALGDVFGARRVYVTGLVVFTAASFVSGCAPGIWVLIAGRVLQGIGAALLVPCSLALLTQTYPNGTARAKAIASFSGWGGVALVIGPLVGGLLVTVFDWRSIFLVNVPFGLAGIWLTLRTGHQATEHGSRRIDLAGQSSLAIAIILMTTALIEGAKLGWGSTWVIAAFAIGLVSACAFIVIERRSRSPMLPLHLFSNSTFSLICYVFLSGATAFFGMLFVLSLFFQQGRGYTPLQTGFALLPLSVGVVIGNTASGKLVSRFDPLRLMLMGSGIRLIGFTTMIFAGTEISRPVIEAQLLLVGLGAGLGSPMSTSIFMSTVGRSYTGIASGIARSTGQVGSAFGIAIFGSLLPAAHDSSEALSVAAFLAAAVTASILAINVYLLFHSGFERESRIPEVK